VSVRRCSGVDSGIGAERVAHECGHDERGFGAGS